MQKFKKKMYTSKAGRKNKGWTALSVVMTTHSYLRYNIFHAHYLPSSWQHRTSLAGDTLKPVKRCLWTTDSRTEIAQ